MQSAPCVGPSSSVKMLDRNSWVTEEFARKSPTDSAKRNLVSTCVRDRSLKDLVTMTDGRHC